MKRVSEIVTIDEVNKWNNGDIITIKAGTGAGKSYFIKNNLNAIAKRDGDKILMLLHRSNCKDQFYNELLEDNKLDNITITTYQHIEALAKKGIEFDFSHYTYICMDEFHYFLQDSNFNKYTDMSFKQILNQSDKKRIMMSATGDQMTKYINSLNLSNKVFNYELPSYYEYIESLNFFRDYETIENLIQSFIDNNEKAIVFVESLNKAKELYEKFQAHAMFNCSPYNSKNVYMDEEKVKDMLDNESFDDLILITTTVMDAGVNIHDDKLNNIICHVSDIGTLIQCVGRKRIKENKPHDKLNLYIKSWSNQRLGGLITKYSRAIEQADYFLNNSIEQYINKYGRDSDNNNIVYDDIDGKGNLIKRVNNLMYFKFIYDIEEIQEMLKRGHNAYKEHLSDIFGFREGDKYMYNNVEEDKERAAIIGYLSNLKGKKLYKDDQEKLKSMFNKNGCKSKTMGINMLNTFLEDMEIDYKIKTGKRKSYRDEEGKVRKESSHWIIGKIIY